MITLKCTDKQEYKSWLPYLVHIGEMFVDVQKEFNNDKELTIDIPFTGEIIPILDDYINCKLVGKEFVVKNNFKFYYFQQYIRMKPPMIKPADLLKETPVHELSSFLNHTNIKDIPIESIWNYIDAHRTSDEIIIQTITAFIENVDDISKYISTKENYYGYYVALIYSRKGKSLEDIKCYLERGKNTEVAYLWSEKLFPEFVTFYGKPFITYYTTYFLDTFGKIYKDHSWVPIMKTFINIALST